MALLGEAPNRRSSCRCFPPQPGFAFASEVRNGSFKLIVPKFSAWYLAKAGLQHPSSSEEEQLTCRSPVSQQTHLQLPTRSHSCFISKYNFPIFAEICINKLLLNHFDVVQLLFHRNSCSICPASIRCSQIDALFSNHCFAPFLCSTA